MTIYSGRTTASQHKRDDWASYDGPIPAAITLERVFNCQWTDCPVEVEAEVKRLWREIGFGNDHFYYPWESDNDYYNRETKKDTKLGKEFPLINEYLRERGIIKCLIHWWW